MLSASRFVLGRSLRSVAALLAIALLLAAAAPAMAESDPTAAQYGNPVQQVSGGAGGGGSSGESSTPAPEGSPLGLQKKVVSGLPFTGLDLIALAAVALALTSMGFVLRRLTFGHDRS